MVYKGGIRSQEQRLSSWSPHFKCFFVSLRKGGLSTCLRSLRTVSRNSGRISMKLLRPLGLDKKHIWKWIFKTGGRGWLEYKFSLFIFNADWNRFQIPIFQVWGKHLFLINERCGDSPGVGIPASPWWPTHNKLWGINFYSTEGCKQDIGLWWKFYWRLAPFRK